MALAAKRTAKGGRKHILMTGETNLKTRIMRNATADMTVVHTTGIKLGMMRVKTEVTGTKTDVTMKREGITRAGAL